MQTAQTLKARRIYISANADVQDALIKIFGDTIIQKTTAIVKSFLDACELTGINAFDEKFTSGEPDEIAHRKLKVIAEALNDGWQPDWDNKSEEKHYPWFYMGSAGAGFRLGGCVFDFDASRVGSRLVFRSRELAMYAATQFLDLYKDYYTA